MAESSFDSASRKLDEGTPRFPLADLPTSRDDSLWEDLRSEYGLSLPELSSLKNYGDERQQGDYGASNFQSEIVDELRGLKRQLEQSGRGRATPLDTPASIGSKVLTELRNLNFMVRVDEGNSSSNLPPVLGSSDVQALSQISNEHQLVAFMTPYFESILGNTSIQVVNSEEYPWLKTSDEARFNHKPDNIFCHSAIYESRDPFNTDDDFLLQLRENTNKYGVLANWALRDSIDVIGEAKMEIDNKAFGEMINYARHICFEDNSPTHIKLLLYDKKEFWMMRATSGEIHSINICRWEFPGSKGILLDFFQLGRSPWIELMNAACGHWKLDVTSNAFLGKGTFGRVFKVSQQTQGRRIHKALKLVLPGEGFTGKLDLYREKQSLDQAASVLPNNVARAEAVHDFGGMGAAMILADVGFKVPRNAWQQVFRTLGALHEQNILHGDPRLANAIYVQGAVRWIDFRTSFVARDINVSLRQKREDLRILVKSCCQKMMTTTEIDLDQYDGTAVSAAAFSSCCEG